MHQPGQRPPPDAAQDVGVHPLAFGAAGTELPLDQPLFAGQASQQRLGDGDSEAVPDGKLAGGEWSVRSRVAVGSTVEVGVSVGVAVEG